MSEDRIPEDGPEEVPEDGGDFRRLSPLTPVARSGIFLAVAAYAGGREVFQEGRLAGVAIGIVAVLVIGAAFGFASWWRTQFRITATELRIDTGLVSRRSRRVRLDRILEIGVDQPFIARLLGLAELKIETATSDSEVSLAYLPLAEAHRVREVLLAHGREVRAEEAAAEAGEDGVAVPPAPPAEPRLRVQVPLQWQVLGVLLSGETIGFAVVVVIGLVLLAVGVPFAAFGIGFFTFVGLALSMARKAIGWWDWKVSEVPTGLQVKHGLGSVTTRTFNVARLQGVRITEPLLQRWAGYARLDLSVAGGGVKDAGEEDSRGVALPVAPRPVVVDLATEVIGTSPDAVGTSLAPTRARWLRPLGQPFLRFGMDERIVSARSGWASRTTDLVPLARVQSFRVRQGPLQRRLRLATVHADTPAGLVSIKGPHRDPADARRAVVEGATRARAASLGNTRGAPFSTPPPG